jgi:hypothetical protein
LSASAWTSWRRSACSRAASSRRGSSSRAAAETSNSCSQPGCANFGSRDPGCACSLGVSSRPDRSRIGTGAGAASPVSGER